MRLPFFQRRTNVTARRLHRLPRPIRRPAENPYFNKRAQRRALRLAPFAGAAVFAIFAVIGMVCALSLSALNVSRIDVIGNNRVSRSDIDAVVKAEYDTRFFGIFPRHNFFLLRTAAIQDQLMTHADIAAAEVAKAFPDRLRITIHERDAAYAVFTDDVRSLADPTGIVFRLYPGEGGGRAATGTSEMTTSTHPISFYVSLIREQATTTYPILYDTSQQSIGEGEMIVPERTRSAYTALARVLESAVSGPRLLGAVYDRLRENELTAVTSEGWLVRMDPGFDISAPLNALTGVLREKVKDRTKLEYVDIRYPDRVYYK